MKALQSFVDGRVVVLVDDLTRQEVDAVVNAANSSLLGGAGVDGAIHRKGGREIYLECEQIRRAQYPKGLPTGKAVITSGGNLPAKFVIHTVGPVYGMNNGNDAELLADSYRNSLQLAVENNLETIAFPSISTGAFGYPKHEAAQVSSRAIKLFLKDSNALEQIRLVFFSTGDAQRFIKHQKL